MSVFYAALPENRTDRNSARIASVKEFAEKDHTVVSGRVRLCSQSFVPSGASLCTVSASLSRPSRMAAVHGMMG